MRIGFAAAMLCAAFLPAASAEVLLVREGKPAAAIYVAADASLPERFAARELQRYLQKSSGARLPIRTEAPRSGRRALVVGQVSRLARLGVRATAAERALGLEGIALRTSGSTLIVAGGGPRGVVYAAYAFLERLGYRWYWPGETGEVTPALSTITVPSLAVTYEPSFRRRHAMGGPEDGWKDVQWGKDVVDWLVKNHQNFWLQSPPGDRQRRFVAERGGTDTKVGSGHNWQHILPPARYFQEHPDWYPEINGQRQPEGQLCLTNPEVIDKLTEYALAGAAKMAKDPSILFVDMSQNDGEGWCECARCRALDDRDPSTRADIVLYALNQVAERVAARYPDAVLMFFVYASAANPPSWIKPAPNLMIEQTNYCYNYGASFLNPRSEQGARFRENLDAWSALATKRGVYDYYGFYNWLEALPVTLYRLADEIGYYKRIGVDGLYSETQQRWSTNHLLYYAFSRLWWDHTTDVKAMLEEFFRLFYGPAAEPMRRFYLALEESGGPDRYWSGDEFNLPQIYPPALRRQCRGWLDEARALAKEEPKVLARLDFVELGWRYTELHLAAMEAHAAFRQAPGPEAKAAARTAWQEYAAYFERLKGTHAFAENELPRWQARAQKQVDAYILDLSRLPTGRFEYRDTLATGGNARLHAQVDGFLDGLWGLDVSANGSASLVYELGAQPGHRWTEAKVAFDGFWDDQTANAIEISLDGQTWTPVKENAVFRLADVHDVTATVRGAERFWVRCRYQNRAPRDRCVLYFVRLSGTIE